VLEEDGVYTIIATSYARGKTGAFRLSLGEVTTRIPANPEQPQVSRFRSVSRIKAATRGI